jgi:beta-1,4-N-acetylglucosaminyltransferase
MASQEIAGNEEVLRNCRLRLLVVLGDGGHTAEMCRLLELIGPEFVYSYVVSSDDCLSAKRVPFLGPFFLIRRPRDKDDSVLAAFFKTISSLATAIRICLTVRPDAILGSGPSLMVPVALASKLVRSRVIFVETGSRVTQLSRTGKIMLLLADLFFVQWETLRERYPRAKFAGRLL